MSYFIGTVISLVFLFMCVFFYRLSDIDWFEQFYTRKFEDKDIFTKFVKWLLS